MIVYSLIIVSIKEAERIELIEKEQTSQVVTGFMKNWMDRSNGHMDMRTFPIFSEVMHSESEEGEGRRMA